MEGKLYQTFVLLVLSLIGLQARGQTYTSKGKITEVASSLNLIKVKAGNGTYDLNTAPARIVDQNGSPGSFSNLWVGREIEIEYEPVAGKSVKDAVVIRLRVPQSIPGFLNVNALVTARRTLIQPALEAVVMKARQIAKPWFVQNFLDPLKFQATIGKGLTLTDEKGESITVTRTSEIAGGYSFSYSFPVSMLISRVWSGHRRSRSDVIVAEGQRDRSLEKEEITLRVLYNDFTEIQDAYSACHTDEGCRKKGSKMRELALKMLILANRQSDPLFTVWQGFKP